MTTRVHAYAATEAGGSLDAFEYELGALGPFDVDIDVEHCGICHSDLSMLNNDWGMSSYPFVPGHEVAGRVRATGSEVAHLSEGDRVGLGWHSGYCMSCGQCMGGDHNLCGRAEQTIVGRHGGFADVVRAQASSVIRLPDGVETSKAGPLFCGGITVFNPLVQYGLSPLSHVGVLGIGGLGHLAVQFARAWGCHVTALTSAGKRAEAIELGAHEAINSRDADELKDAAGRFDLLISTVNVSMDWSVLLDTLKPKGRLHNVGAVLEPLEVPSFSLIMAQRSVSGSPVGSPATIASMLAFSARHGIAPVTEHYPMAEVNAAIQRLASGSPRFRVVLDRSPLRA